MGGGGTAPFPVALFGDGDVDDVDDDNGGGAGREPGCGAGGDEVASVDIVEVGYVLVGVYTFPDVLNVEVGAGIAGAPGLAAG